MLRALERGDEAVPRQYRGNMSAVFIVLIGGFLVFEAHQRARTQQIKRLQSERRKRGITLRKVRSSQTGARLI